MSEAFWILSFAPIVIGALSAISCAMLGNFLILRRQALIGDAMSHVVLPGIVIGFLLSGHVHSAVMILGAGAAAIFSVLLIEAIKRIGRVEAGAAMGVVFTAMFAFGVLLLETSDTSSVHLDVEHALYGNLESLIWLDGAGWWSIFDWAALKSMPGELWGLLWTALVIAVFLAFFWRALVISTFDEGFAKSIGIPTRALNIALVLLAALASVMSFSAVGAIIVIAMFICPPAAARLLSARMTTQLWLSVGFALVSAVLGYYLAGYGPLWVGLEHSVSAAGMIACVSGVIMAWAVIRSTRKRD